MTDDDSVLNLDELRTFVVVAEERHFGRAASRLHLSQPAVSRHVSRLESACGARLLNRTKRRVSITVAGEVVLQHARALQAAAGRMRQHVRDVSSGAIGRVRVGVTRTPMFQSVGKRLLEFRAAWPRFDVECRLGHRSDLAEAVRRNDLDMAVVSGPPGIAELRAEQIGRTPVSVVWAPSTGLSPNPRDWPRDVPWIVRAPRTSDTACWDEWRRRQPTAPVAGLIVDTVHDQRAAALLGLGPTLLPEGVVLEDVRAGHLRRHRGTPRMSQGVYLIDHPEKHHGAACQAMLSMLRSPARRARA